MKEEISRTEPGRVEPKEIIRDPYILEFLGIPQGEHFLETDLEQLLISRLQRFMLELLCKPLHNNSYANKFIMQSDLN